MSRRDDRIRKRLARQAELRAEFAQKRHDPVALAEMVRRVAAAREPLWPIAEAAAGDDPLDEEEMAMIAQAVAPHLVGTAPHTGRKRHEENPRKC